jgi:hypothetical protein
MTTAYRKTIRAPFLFITLFLTVTAGASLFAVPQISHADAATFAPTVKLLNENQAFSLSASWNGTSLPDGATTTVPIGQSGSLSFNFSVNPAYARSPQLFNPGSLDSVLSSATLTIDLYKGVIGSSTLVYSQTISSSTPSVTFPVSFDTGGQYFLALSATYPSGTYPPGKGPSSCGGDFCFLPKYSLTAFQNAMTRGDDLAGIPGALAWSFPAALGFLNINIASAAKLTSNVLFLPGTLESRLYMRDTNKPEKELWEPVLDHDVSLLALNPDGTSKHLIYTRDVMDYLYSHTPSLEQAVRSVIHDKAVMYGPFEKFMDDMVSSKTITQWQAYPYDWRFDVSDIVKNGTLVGNATGTPTRVYLTDVIQQLASTSPTGKVTIIAHSNGGLLAKAFAVKLQKEGRLDLLDQMILVGTPQLGTPKAIGTMLHGDDQLYGIGLASFTGTNRTATLTMPGSYDLLPSPAYFDKVQTPVVSFGNGTLDTPYRARYGTDIMSYSKLTDFITNVGNSRSIPVPSDLKTPAILSSVYVQKAQATHAAIDAWVPPPSLAVTSIAGWGQPTPSRYPYSTQIVGWGCSFTGFFKLNCGSNSALSHSPPTMTQDGDDTVVAPSAASLGQVLYLDTIQAARNGIGTTNHQSLLSSIPIESQITNLLKGVSTTEQYIKVSQPTSGANPLLVVSAHSPVNILATDSNGNQSGIVPVTGFPDIYFIKEDIPESSVHTFDDEKYISLPPNGNYSFSYQGYAAGQTTIQVDRVDGNGSTTSSQIFAAIPTTASTTATFSVSQSIATAPAVDINGTGKIDLIASSSISNTSTSTALLLLKKRNQDSKEHFDWKDVLDRFLRKLKGDKDPNGASLDDENSDRVSTKDLDLLKRWVGKIDL